MGEVNPGDIRVFVVFGTPRPALVVWVDEAQDAMLIAALTRSKIVKPVYRLHPVKDVPGMVSPGGVSACVMRMKISHSVTAKLICRLKNSKLQKIAEWLTKEIDL